MSWTNPGAEASGKQGTLPGAIGARVYRCTEPGNINSGNRSAGSTAGTGGIAGGGVGGTSSGAGSVSSNQNSGGIGGNAGASGGMGNNASSSSGATALAGGQSSRIRASQDEIRSQLTSGIPAAVYSNGQSFVLACDPRQLATYAGQSVRVSGRIGSNNVLIPSKVEVREASGSYRSVALVMPRGSNTGAANER